MKKQKVYRACFYVLGLLILAMGLTLNTKAGLGVSPIISVSYSISTIFQLNFGDMTLVLYSIFVVAELLLHSIRERRRRLKGEEALVQARKKRHETDSAHGCSPDSPESYFYKISECI